MTTKRKTAAKKTAPKLTSAERLARTRAAVIAVAKVIESARVVLDEYTDLLQDHTAEEITDINSWLNAFDEVAKAYAIEVVVAG